MANEAQREFWTAFSDIWVTHQDRLDASFAPILDEVLTRASLQSGDRVLDIGCGTGTSTVRAAQLVGATGHVTGVDISAPMIQRAKEVAALHPQVTLDVADAAEATFPAPGFHRVISRFGTMFFEDSVAAFGNIRAAMAPGATLTMACWSNLDANPWFKVPMLAAKEVLGAPPKVDPDAPGPMAFRDIERVTGILRSAGFDAVSGEAVTLTLTPSGALRDVAYQSSLIGPAARTLEHFSGGESDLRAIAERVADGYRAYVVGDTVRVPAEINFFSARIGA